jgi:GTP cyclohydrolase I
MTTKIILTQDTISQLSIALVREIEKAFENRNPGKAVKIYGIPRGGMQAAYAVSRYLFCTIVDTPEQADAFVDDIIDSGTTMREYCDKYPGKPFFALVDKTDPDCTYKNDWIVFPWEAGEGTGIEDNVRRMLQFAGDKPEREGLLETPARVAKAYEHWFSGYKVDIAGLLKVFEDGAAGYDEMVIVRDIPIYSKCEHHVADIFGTVSIAYIPNGRIVGLSKLSRVADAFARRLQVQERLTGQIADALMEHLQPKGVGVIMRARHMCMESRGLCQQGHHTITSALRGVIKTDPAARAEFINLTM